MTAALLLLLSIVCHALSQCLNSPATLDSSHKSLQRVRSHLGFLLIQMSSGQLSKVDSDSGILQRAILGSQSQTGETTSVAHYQNY